MKKSHWILGMIVAGACAGMVLPSASFALTAGTTVLDCGSCGDDEGDDEEALLADCGGCGDKEESDDEVLLA